MRKQLALIVMVIIFALGMLILVKQYRLKDNGRVEPLPVMLTREMQICMGEKESNLCYRKLVSDLLTQFTPQEIFEVLQDTQQETAVFNRCHTLNHFIGQRLYQMAGDLPAAFASCSDLCTNGCYHGVVEGYAQKNYVSADSAGYAAFVGEIGRICADGRIGGLAYECYHGIGHALMVMTNMDVPVSLGFCDILSTTAENPVQLCYAGVFMENFASASADAHASRFLKAEDPLYPCNTLKEPYLRECHRRQAFYFLDVTNKDWDKTVALCGQIRKDYQPMCIFQVSENIAGWLEDISVATQRCSKLSSDNLQNACVSGVVSTLHERYPADHSRMVAFCASVENNNKKSCYGQIGMSASDWGKNSDESIAACELVVAQHKDACLHADVVNYRNSK